MKELLLYMAKNLVDDPESVTVTEVETEDGISSFIFLYFSMYLSNMPIAASK